MPPILFAIKNNIAFITLNQPHKFNAFDRTMALLLQDYLDECARLPEVRCVYITGTGKAFSAGQDIGELSGEKKMDIAQILSEHFNPIVSKIKNLPKPIVAAVNGAAAGAGANIALCCDVVLAAHSAYFIQAFSKIGLIPDSGGTYILPRLIGWQKASALMMLGDKISAADAEKMGMIYKVFEDNFFEEESKKIAMALAQLPTQALAFTKHALIKSCTNSWEQQLLLEDEYQQKAAATLDYTEGINAFLQKRKPIFKGE